MGVRYELTSKRIAIVVKSRSEPAMKDPKLEIDTLALRRLSVRPRTRRTPIDFIVGVVLATAALPVVAGDGGTGGTGGAVSSPGAVGGTGGTDGQNGGTGGTTTTGYNASGAGGGGGGSGGTSGGSGGSSNTSTGGTGGTGGTSGNNGGANTGGTFGIGGGAGGGGGGGGVNGGTSAGPTTIESQVTGAAGGNGGNGSDGVNQLTFGGGAVAEVPEVLGFWAPALRALRTAQRLPGAVADQVARVVVIRAGFPVTAPTAAMVDRVAVVARVSVSRLLVPR
jgi:hypothetical protein